MFHDGETSLLGAKWLLHLVVDSSQGDHKDNTGSLIRRYNQVQSLKLSNLSEIAAEILQNSKTNPNSF